MIILGIETSCDDTSISLIKVNTQSNNNNLVTFDILTNIVAGQNDFHREYGGVVPEIAARKHVEMLFPTLEKVFKSTGVTIKEVNAIAVTTNPGLVGSLLVGVECAKTIALLYNKPLIAVDHLKAHFFSIAMEGKVCYPYIGLLVSGGHTMLALCHSPVQVALIGSTLDDACGECFDKVAKYYGLGYPGGPVIEKVALEGDENSFVFPRPMVGMVGHENPYQFSFSGLKTAVIHYATKYLKYKNSGQMSNARLALEISVPDLAASFQKVVVDHLLEKTLAAAKVYNIHQVGVCGGVSANSYLRERFSRITAFNSFFPSFDLCTDNAAMIAGLGYYYFQVGDVVKDIERLNPIAQSFKKHHIL